MMGQSKETRTRNVPLGISLVRSLGPRCVHREAAYKALAAALTFFTYMTYHMSRKAISVVKTEWYPDNCSKVNHTVTACPTSNTTGSGDDGVCDCWGPFTNDSKLGDLDFAFLLGYAVAMFASGQIGDRVNLRYFLFVGMTLTALFTSLLGLAYFYNIQHMWFFVLINTLGGMVQSTGWPAVVAIMANWFGVGNRGFILGLWNSHTSFGNIIGAIIPAVWVHHAWGWSFIVPGLIVAGMAVIVLLFLVVDPEDVDCPPTQQHLPPPSSGANVTADTNSDTEALFPVNGSSPGGYGAVNTSPDVSPPARTANSAVGFFAAFKIPGVLEYSLCLFFSKLVNYIFLYWLPPYVHAVKVHGHFLTPEKSAFFSSLFDVGGIVGGVLLGIFSDRTGASATGSVAMLLLGIPVLYVFNAYGGESLAALLSLMALTGLLLNGPYSLITTAVAADLGTHEALQNDVNAKATVAAIIDGTGSIGAALGPYLVGIILQEVNNPWQYVVHICMASSLLSAVFLSRITYKELSLWRRRSRGHHSLQ